MRRRDVLAGAAGLAVLGVGGAFAVSSFDPLDDEPFEPIELEGIEAPGSSATTVTVPEPGRVSLVEVFATWCGACQRMMSDLGVVHEEFGDEIQFVSVTNEPLGNTKTRGDVAEWWADHDGTWQVAHDGDLTLTERLDATGVPYSFVFDEENRLRWSGKGYKNAEELRGAIGVALE